ncbi:arginine biosynthesis bifunctional protein ArgJ [Anaeromyxobacter dehalogenans 2CP-1]|uniref:Arginine biosynthesis bifunctional protein ArgJ n=1 Tax=Anaeromyxobacter dehalogenans (strain ATCC BAA-258 / DSM 21875 / 2CP-1) TaxID=455488 RepID=B8JC49_ANAD2|nr:bifunctional glutamate N-acetyltransferase/amino-acid acetyltransferase ArgJ [Anaeromyxobacter dehalogenans]ACL63971.1 arginine biosynthesis bifunctional protein ArgJ [Anaeromyxobacter dehalogenans 2CP-1]
MRIPKGFRFGGVACGLKPQRRDLALVVSDHPAAAAGLFTINRAAAAPVIDARTRVPAEGIRAIVVNSGNANALTGPAGLDDVTVIRAAVADALGLQKRAVLTASTGVIGARLPAMKVVTALPALVDQLGDHPDLAAEAIMTTDTRPKMAAREVTLGGKTAIVTAICKGSGMLAPQLATTICLLVTDAAVTPRALQDALARAVERTLHMVTVDGEMSTNDTVYALANGLAGNPRISDPGPDLDRLETALTDLLEEMARAMAADGEGATKLVEVVVSGAPSDEAARDCARAVASSPLVKAALFGADPNWGRVLATVGARAGAMNYPIDPYRARVVLQGVTVFEGGAPVELDREGLRTRMRDSRIDVLVELADGTARAVAWGCDLSYDYVKINADYTSLIVQRPDGGVGKDDRVSNYSPAFKRTLLAEALKYIAAFSGQVAVIKYGGAAMVKDSLKAAFAEDVTLLKKVGLKPVVVHGGAPEITRTLEKLGERSEFVDGMRITDAQSLPVVEMVLTGKVNQELVALLNARSAGAVGLSGKDGQLLRARKAVHESGRDLGYVGEVVQVNTQFLRMFLDGGYVPVISPIGLTDDGTGLSINADDVAAAIAVALGAPKLIYLTDVAGVLESAPDGQLVRQLTLADLDRRIQAGAITGGMKWKAWAIQTALRGGVGRVHVLDGRQPHTVIAELFTDRGVGSLLTAE